MKDHYKILGIAPEATQEAIKKAYRMLALRHHPDRNGGNAASEARFKEISESYLVIGDASRRQAYDDWRFRRENAEYNYSAQKVTPVSFLITFRNIREKVFNAGGYIKEEALFNVINNLLTTENLNFLVLTADIRTNSMIIDEILISSVFLDDSSKMVLYRKLVRLAHGDALMREKISVLTQPALRPAKVPVEEPVPQEYAWFFIAFVLALILLGIFAG
ncbi:DnaJ domain-containing protein [uncultured Flavobacterium sp.]|uniref:J domain-containing protein n=1 Tax=uncultured Flavobacterium sp. TaxID=165435 RepID=UPI0025EC7C95|nr:DnaJ domain-containing protein [uncultured Flavobacterium sp.]